MESNVNYTLEAVDARALEETFNKKDIESWIIQTGKNSPYLYFKKERYAMNGNGYHVGYEVFVGRLKLYEKSEFYVHGVPYALSPYIVFPNQLEVDGVTPAEEPREYTVHDAVEYLKSIGKDEPEFYNFQEYEHDPDYIMQLAHDNGMSEGDYFPPDEDFAFHELDHVLQDTIKGGLVQAEFHPTQNEKEEDSEWSLGRYWFIPRTLKTGKEY